LLYVAYLAESGLAHGTIKCYLSAIRHLHIAGKRGDPGIRAGIVGYQTYAGKGEEKREGAATYLRGDTWQTTSLLEEEGHPGYRNAMG
jgi:hypothetical protein